jgi:L-alanine-DL-glutamate epimerase-like enolase superfamily enzyme
MVHCHWEYDLRTSIQIADAVESSRPLWLEDPLTVDYTDSWRRLCASSKLPILMGENLARREDFKNFIINSGCDIVNPDLRNSGGFLETKRIADLAHIYGIPRCNHNTGSQVYTYAAAQFGAAVRDYMALRDNHRRGRLDGSGAVARCSVRPVRRSGQRLDPIALVMSLAIISLREASLTSAAETS